MLLLLLSTQYTFNAPQWDNVLLSLYHPGSGIGHTICHVMFARNPPGLNSFVTPCDTLFRDIWHWWVLWKSLTPMATAIQHFCLFFFARHHFFHLHWFFALLLLFWRDLLSSFFVYVCPDTYLKRFEMLLPLLFNLFHFTASLTLSFKQYLEMFNAWMPWLNELVALLSLWCP